jgi:hypothetical protein
LVKEKRIDLELEGSRAKDESNGAVIFGALARSDVRKTAGAALLRSWNGERGAGGSRPE